MILISIQNIFSPFLFLSFSWDRKLRGRHNMSFICDISSSGIFAVAFLICLFSLVFVGLTSSLIAELFWAAVFFATLYVALYHIPLYLQSYC